MHRQYFGDLVDSTLAHDERRAQHAAHLRGEVLAPSDLECVDVLLQQTAQIGIDGGQATIQPIGGEHDGVLRGVEHQGRDEEPTERADVLWLAMGKSDLEGRPIGAAQLPHDVEHDRDRGIPDLLGGLDMRLVDFVP